MHKSYWTLITIIMLMLWEPVQIKAQSLPVGTAVLGDAYRRAQLLGQLDSTVSFTSLPLFPASLHPQKNAFDPDSMLHANSLTKFTPDVRFGHHKGILKLLPVTWNQQYNADRPQGINDGAMIPARGYQTLITGGVFAKYGPLSIQLQPEMLFAQNRAYQCFSGTLPGNTPSNVSGIDLPERFGENAYNKLFWGQSSIRLTVGPASLGISNENLWWGPGMRNSLLMTNNAPGFKHLTLNTVRPIRTFIGSFEGQMIAGHLDESGYQISNKWRYLNGVVVSYQPRWVPGLFLGAARSLMTYGKSLRSFRDYLPVFIPITKQASGGVAQDTISLSQDQLASVFARWLWPEEHGEIYFEFGREDHAWNSRDYLLEPSHSGAYILGIRKLIIIKGWEAEYLQIGMEITQLESSMTTIERDWTVDWYTHSDVTEGYTQKGQVLGAGIGPGSNLQTLNISWVKSLKVIGIQLERYVHNNNYQYNVIGDIRRNWVDLSAAAIGEWDYKNLLLHARLEVVRSYNYEWEYLPMNTNTTAFWNPTKDRFNFQGQLSLTYRF